jgi:AcrR family transcriptional regulator
VTDCGFVPQGSTQSAAFAERAARRKERLIEVGFELMGELGAGGTTVREVCSRSRLNPRYFYESFAELDELLVAVFDKVMSETIALSLAAVAAAPADREAKVRAAVETGIRHLTADPRRILVMYGDSAGSRGLTRRRMQAISDAAAIMTAQAVAFYGLPNGDRFSRSSGQFLAGGLGQLLLAWQDGTLAISVDELIDDATALINGSASRNHAAPE